MTTSMTVICLINIKQQYDNKGYVNGSATYRSSQKNYKNFDFKFFENQNNTDIQAFEEGDIVVFTGKFCYREDFDGENPLFLSVNQAISFPRSKTSWNRDSMPIAHPYVTLTVYISANPLTKFREHDVIKSKCCKNFCSYDKKKYDSVFYLHYIAEGTRWTRTVNAIKKGNMKVHISGFYLGYLQPESSGNSSAELFQAIQLTELDFESKPPKSANHEEDDDFFFGPTKKKHQLSPSSPSENETSTSSNISNEEKKKRYKKKKSKKTKYNSSTASSTEDDASEPTQSTSYINSPAREAIETLSNKKNPTNDLSTTLHSKNYPPHANYYAPPYNNYFPPPYYSPYYPPPPPHNYHDPANFKKEFSTRSMYGSSSDTKNIPKTSFPNLTDDLRASQSYQVNEEANSPVKTNEKKDIKSKNTKSVKFEDQEEEEDKNLASDNDLTSDNKKNKKGKKNTRGKKSVTVNPTTTRVLRDKSKRKSTVMDIAVNKITTETSAEEDDMIVDKHKKTESFMMDTD